MIEYADFSAFEQARCREDVSALKAYLDYTRFDPFIFLPLTRSQIGQVQKFVNSHRIQQTRVDALAYSESGVLGIEFEYDLWGIHVREKLEDFDAMTAFMGDLAERFAFLQTDEPVYGIRAGKKLYFAVRRGGLFCDGQRMFGGGDCV